MEKNRLHLEIEVWIEIVILLQLIVQPIVCIACISDHVEHFSSARFYIRFEV